MSKSCLSPTISPSVVDGDGAIRDSLPRHDGTVPRQLDLAVDGPARRQVVELTTGSAVAHEKCSGTPACPSDNGSAMMASMTLSSGAGTPAKLTATLWFGWKERLVLEHSCLVTSGSGRRGGRCGGRRPWGSCCSGTGPAFHVHGFLVVIAVGIACAGDGR